jgi:flagellar biosynthesis/type III secretory pathway protein FliH
MTIASRLIDIGVQQGVQQGIQQGVQQGVKQGQRRGEFQFLLSLLERKFGPIPAFYRARIKQASEQLLAWGTRLLEVNSLEVLFEEVLSTSTL